MKKIEGNIDFFADFSAIDWGAQLGLNLTDFTGILAKNVAQLLLQQLGLDELMDVPGCSRNADQYQPSVYGWKNSKSSYRYLFLLKF